MVTLVLPPPEDRFTCQLERHRRMLVVPYTTNKPDRQRSAEAAPTLHNAKVFAETSPQAINEFKPADLSYGILSSPGNNVQYPHGSILQFPHANNLQFPPGNNFQFCPVNGLQSSSVSGLQQRPRCPYSTASPDCETVGKPGLLVFPPAAIFPWHQPPAISPSAHPPMPPPLADFSGCNSVGTAPPGCTWHSMGSGFLSLPTPLSGADDFAMGGQSTAPLRRRGSLAGGTKFSCRSPERLFSPGQHLQSCPSKYVSQENSKTTRSHENTVDDYKSRSWQPGQKPNIGVADKCSWQRVSEGKSVDNGAQKPQKNGRAGSAKQAFTAPCKVANEKKNIVKKVVSAMKSGGKSNSIKSNGSLESKVVTILQRPPKAEAAEKNLTKVFGEFVNGNHVGHNQNVVCEQDLGSSHTSNGICVDKSVGSCCDGVSGYPYALHDNSEDHGGRNRCNKGCSGNGRTDQQDARHWNCSIADEVQLTTDERGCRKNELGPDLAASIPILGDDRLFSKESKWTSQFEHSVPLKALRAVQSQLEPEASLEGGLFPTATTTANFDDIGKEVCSVSLSFSMGENWAGPAYSNSPPPSSLPFPKFSMRQMRSVSLELPFVNGEFSEAVIDATLPGSRSAPSSPARDMPEFIPSRGKLQGLRLDVVSATKDLRRMLNLDFSA